MTFKSMNTYTLAATLTLFSTVSLVGGTQLLLNSAPANAGPRLSSTLANAGKANAKAVKTGTFGAAEHPIAGKAKIVTENGTRYLMLNSSFKSDAGPDLHVILYRNATVPVKDIAESDYVILGQLQKVAGTQRYIIPTSVKLADYNSAAIWCRQFNATFGYAPLQG